MLPERLILGALLLAALVMITGCATTAKSEDDYETLWRNASDECIRFGHVIGSDGYSNCMVKRLGSGKEISVAGGDTKQTSPEIPPLLHLPSFPRPTRTKQTKYLQKVNREWVCPI